MTRSNNPQAWSDNLIIAEIGSVHDGSIGNAGALIRAARKAGADAVKFQMHISDCETLETAPNPAHFQSESRKDYFNRTAFSLEEWRRLIRIAEEEDILFLCSPFSPEAVRRLIRLGVNAIKIPSGEVTNLPMLEMISGFDIPVFLSTGMSNYAEVDQAVEIFSNASMLRILQCSSEYPCSAERSGIKEIPLFIKKYGDRIGFSDHTEGVWGGISAACLGAKVIEKHLTFSRGMYGSDARFAAEPDTFKLMAEGIRAVWSMQAARYSKDDLRPYLEVKKIYEKGIVAAYDLPKGHEIVIQDLSFKKPSLGLRADETQLALGRRTKVSIKKNTTITFQMLD
jgi:N,N'-diacetyllegionaminate synthase